MKRLDLIQYTDNYNKENSIRDYTYYIDDLKDIDIFIKYLYSIIDECDHFYFERNNDYSRKIETELGYECYDELYINGYLSYRDVKIFDISSNAGKKYLKDNLKFNIADPNEREPYNTGINHKNIANDDRYDSSNSMNQDIHFIKNGDYIYLFGLYDGFLYDYKKKIK